MVDLTKTFVYNGKEYYLTGRIARNEKKKKNLMEIKLKHAFGYENELALWVMPEELYEINEIKKGENNGH